MTERTFTAYHEAGHAVAAVLLRGPDAVRWVTIVPSGDSAGVTMLNTGSIDMTDHGAGAYLADPPLRATVERLLIGTLAGAEAGKLARLQSGWDEPSEDEQEAVRVVTTTLPPRDDELIFGAGSADPFDLHIKDDDFEIGRLAQRFAGLDEAPAYVAWLRVAARNLVLRHWSAVERVAAALLARNVLSGAEVAEIVRGGAP